MLGNFALGQQALGGSGIRKVTLSAAVGAYTLTGQDASLRVSRRLAADVGAFTLTGQADDNVRGRLGLSVRSGGGVSRLLAASGGGGRGLRIRA